MGAFITFKYFFRQPANLGLAATSSFTLVLPPPMSRVLLSIASTTIGTGYRGIWPQRKRPITMPRSQRRSFLRIYNHLRIWEHRAAETLPRLGPTCKGESGCSVETDSHILLNLVSNFQVS